MKLFFRYLNQKRSRNNSEGSGKHRESEDINSHLIFSRFSSTSSFGNGNNIYYNGEFEYDINEIFGRPSVDSADAPIVRSSIPSSSKESSTEDCTHEYEESNTYGVRKYKNVDAAFTTASDTLDIADFGESSLNPIKRTSVFSVLNYTSFTRPSINSERKKSVENDGQLKPFASTKAEGKRITLPDQKGRIQYQKSARLPTLPPRKGYNTPEILTKLENEDVPHPSAEPPFKRLVEANDNIHEEGIRKEKSSKNLRLPSLPPWIKDSDLSEIITRLQKNFQIRA